MGKYICTGHVQPERAAVYFDSLEIHWGEGQLAVVTCDASQVTVVLDGEGINDYVTAQIFANHLAGMVVGALGFSLGSGYSVEIYQVIEPDGTPHVFGVRPKGEHPNETLGFELHLEAFNRALFLSKRDIFFRFALRDYLHAVYADIDCAMYCYRAIEGIKASFVYKTGHDRWSDMHRALGTDQNKITTTIKTHADPARHGNWININPTSSHDRWEMLKLTRDILIKYLDYTESTIQTN
jgi:hypothetical protein